MASGPADLHAQREAEDIKVWFRFVRVCKDID
jgi:hypothetical protein